MEGLVAWVFVAPVLVGLGFVCVLALEWPPSWVWFGVAALCALTLGLFVGLPSLSYRFTGYRLESDHLASAEGVFWRSRHYVPRSRVQHVDVVAGPIARRFGLCSFSVFVGGRTGAAVTIGGITPEEAERLREALLPRPIPPVVALEPAE